MRAARSVAGLVLFGLMIPLAGTAQAGTDLYLLGDRFRVSAEWRTADGVSGAATAIPRTGETGLFWFFSPGNVELVVKVLDACTPPYERFWFYASGLTDVEVELTVEDTWTGQTKTYLRPRGAMFAPLADTSTFNGCGVPPPPAPCGQGTKAEIAATPRPDFDAETLALLLSPGRITADPQIYTRIEDDLARIRANWPALSQVSFLWLWHPSGLSLKLKPEAYAAVRAGTFREWDCLNAWYGAKGIHVYSLISWAGIGFKGRFHIPRIMADYAALPGVELVDAHWNSIPASDIPDDICVAIDGAAYDYFLDQRWDVNRLWYFRVPHAGAMPIAIGNFGAGDPVPEWLPRYEQCGRDLHSAAFH